MKPNVILFYILSLLVTFGCGSNGVTSSYSTVRPKIIHLDTPVADNGMGGIIIVDVNDDQRMDFVITKPAHLAVYDHSGNNLWSIKVDIQLTIQSETNGLPGWHGPGVQAADVNGDCKTEVLFLTRDGALHVVEGDSGATVKKIPLESPPGTERWEHLVVANFRGKGDRDLLLQTTNAKGYRMGRYLAAYALDDLMQRGNTKPLWTRDDFIANAHNGARVADLDGDGKDEVLGGTIIGPDGRILFQIPLRGHIDSIFVADVRPDIPGLEVVALEEGGAKLISNESNRMFWFINRVSNRIVKSGNHVFLYNHEQLIWQVHYKHQEPQNAAVGEFDPTRPGLEVWCRSRFNKHQKPFVFDAQGHLIADYEMDNVAPVDWTAKGVEVIFAIHWTGEAKQLAAAKERHKSGNVAIFDPFTGEFRQRFDETADRLYVADVYDDWREEIIVLNGDELRIYSNDAYNHNPTSPRLWEQNHYLRSKMTWNYYSP